MILTLNLPLSIKSQNFVIRNRILFVFIFFNTLALVHFGALQLRALFGASVGERMLWILLSNLCSYNVWSIGGAILLRNKSTINLAKWIQFFIIASISYSLINAVIFQYSLGQPVQLDRVLRSFLLTGTGFIHLNILFTICLFVIHKWSGQNISISRGEKRLTLKGAKGLRLVGSEEIIFVKAEQNYVKVQFKDEADLFRYKIGDLGETLTKDMGFVRIHRSFIVNTKFIKEITPSENGIDVNCLVGKDFLIPISRSRKKELLSFINA